MAVTWWMPSTDVMGRASEVRPVTTVRQPMHGAQQLRDRHRFAHDEPAPGRILELPELVGPATDVHRRADPELRRGGAHEVGAVTVRQPEVDDEDLGVAIDLAHA